MSVDVVEYSSEVLISDKKIANWETVSKNGLNWSIKLLTDFENLLKLEEYVFLKWSFDWDELEKQGVTGFEGTMITTVLISSNWKPIKHDVIFALDKKDMEIKVSTIAKCNYHSDKVVRIKYEFKLKPISSTAEDVPEEIVVDPMFAASELTDIALNVEGHKLHVSKHYLATHSAYFRTLFFSDFKEKSMDEIPIVDVKYTDFELLMKTIYPLPVLPTDKTAEKLLELADRFQMPSVTYLVQLHLSDTSAIRLSKMIHLAEKYRMERLFAKLIIAIKSDTRDKCSARVKVILSSEYYPTISEYTVRKLLEIMCSY